VNYRARQRLRQKQRRPQPVPGDRAKTLDDYLKLPYEITLVRDEEGGKPGWVARVEELPGCTTRARNPQEAASKVSHLLSDWIAAAIQEGRDVPEPKSGETHSGRLLLRMPRTLHGELTRVAERERVSLNQFITDVLAGAVGWRAPAGARRRSVQRLDDVALHKLDDDQLSMEPPTASRLRWRRSPALVTAVLAANFVIVAVAGVVAVLVLIAAW
jgi:predicted RNase H-like HicB family nuclease